MSLAAFKMKNWELNQLRQEKEKLQKEYNNLNEQDLLEEKGVEIQRKIKLVDKAMDPIYEWMNRKW
jgi:DNA-binding transcriptional regulator GbsR (MarR family)